MNLFTLIGTRIDRWVLPLVSRHALSVLKREYGCMEAHQILWRAWAEFGPLTRRIPTRHPLATRVILSFAAASAALHRALMFRGASETRASAVVAEIGLRTYRPLWRVPWWLGRLMTLDNVDRLGMTIRLFRFFVYRGPAYGMRQLSFPDGRVSLDAHRCPVIAYYEDLEIPHLCRPLVCDLDFALGERTFDEKVAAALGVVRAELPACCLSLGSADRKDCEEVQP